MPTSSQRRSGLSHAACGPLRGKHELEALLDILAPTFNFNREQGLRYSAIVGRKNYRVVRSRNQVLGGCALLPMKQFFGGKAVPVTGVAAVGIAPEHRGQKIATTLMKHCLEEMHERGSPLAALYPATLSLYRSMGYQQAGSRYEIRMPLKSLQVRLQPADRELEIRRIGDDDMPAIHACYRNKAMHTNGHLDRGDFHWHRVREPRGQKTMGFMAYHPRRRQAEGYTFYYQKECPEAPYSLHATEVTAISASASRRLLHLLADHRSMAHEVIFDGAPDDPLLLAMHDRFFAARLQFHWMLRIVNVVKALSRRGYAREIMASINIEVLDDVLPSNTGGYVIHVNDGAAAVRKGGSGAVRCDIRGLAAMYSGFMTPWQLRAAGLVDFDRAGEDQAHALATMFAGNPPWMPDMF